MQKTKEKNLMHPCKCNECGKVFDYYEDAFEDMFGDTVCPTCGSEDIEEE